MAAQRITVERSARNERLDRYLVRMLPGVSLERVRELIGQPAQA